MYFTIDSSEQWNQQYYKHAIKFTIKRFQFLLAEHLPHQRGELYVSIHGSNRADKRKADSTSGYLHTT